MNGIHLSKSKYCHCLQCKKLFWLDEYKPEYLTKTTNSTIEIGKKVGQFARGLFGSYQHVSKDNKQVMAEKTLNLLKNKPNIITEASFIHDNNFCSVDILKNDSDGVEIYEVKSVTNIMDDKSERIQDKYLDDISYQYYVLDSCGLKIKKASLVYINKEYVKGKLPVEDKLEKFFIIEDVTNIVKENRNTIRNNIEIIYQFMEEYGEDNEPISHLDTKCIDSKCKYMDYCTKDLPKPNIFDIKGLSKTIKIKKYYENKISFEDLQQDTDLNSKYLEQIDFELNDKEPKIEKEVIKDLLDALKYPLYFIDYETFKPGIPEIEGTTPTQQIPFQYSLHILREKDAKPEHKEFLAQRDDKTMIRHFAESMIESMPEEGSVIVYNKSFESGRNREIGEMYPDLKDEMERINSNMVDFMIPFQKRQYYTKKMRGSYSIKQVLPALCPELDYGNLPGVHDGGEASYSFLTLNDNSPEKQEEIRDGLLAYCCLDTFAMVKIYEKFKEVLGE